ncbi:class I SAM-dependent methyltransferase [Bacillus solimangrovi]|uniref:16S rRNA methyltransferase n=1 Tax=Bacillus solimangrovi TaxID=1305675 RepID=A0A1E5LGH3_9BACI|nr:class I SAM-dependent methyltransferase [Bacillus solimangrovi]OEH93179.1 16S rRNA methyltransferase [Bacillus solimangrovi]
MADHYFSDRPSSTHKPFSFSYQLRGFSFIFHSDSGVFSKKEIDFGSRLMIESFEEPNVEGSILDIGCGYGPVGLTLAKAFPERMITMTDINERAVQLAKQNAVGNKIENVQVFASNLFEQISSDEFSAILTNPPIRAGKNIVHKIFSESYDRLRENGELWVVIQKKQGAPSALEKIREQFAEVEVVAKKKGYYVIRAIKS